MAKRSTTAPTVRNIALEDFIHLASSSVQNGSLGTRPLNEKHINVLAHSDYTQWPNLEAVERPEGIVLIDGYHRLEAAKRIGIPEPEEDKVPNGDHTVEPVTSLAVNIRQYESDIAIVKAALLANVHHGLAANAESRTRLGLVLLEEMVAKGETPRYTEAAKEAGISKVTLWEAWGKWQKRKEKLAKQAPKEATEATESEESASPSGDETEKAFKKFATALRTLDTAIIDSEGASHLLAALHKEGDLEVLDRIAKLLNDTVKLSKKPAKKSEGAKKKQKAEWANNLTHVAIPFEATEAVPEAVAETQPEALPTA